MGIVPASLKINWQREAKKWLVQPRHIVIVTPKTHVEELQFLDDQDKNYIVPINYELTSKKSNYGPQNISFGPFDMWLRSRNRDFVFWDVSS